jgi:hypothetical protein
MGKLTTLTTGRASLCALGEYLRRRCFFAPLQEQVKIAPNVVKYRPTEKLLDGLLSLRCGAKTIAHSPVTINVDPAVQRAFGRQGCAEQAPLARTLQAGTAANVAELDRVVSSYLQRSGATPRHPFHPELVWVEAEVPPLPIGGNAEGRERAWRGRQRSQTGRKPRRLSARASREILYEPRLRGTAWAVPALKTALDELEGKLGWTREIRQRSVIRLASGFGTTAVRNGRRSRGSQVVAKISQRGRVRQLGQQRGPWQPTSSTGRAIAEGLAPVRFCRQTRPWGIRTPKEKGGYQSALLVTTVLELPPAAWAERSDGRAMSEATFCQDKQGLGLVKRRQRKGEAHQMVLRLARLAPHLLVWSPRWLSRVPAIRWRLRGSGVVRLCQEVWAVPGMIRYRRGWRVSVHFSPLHHLAKLLQQGFAVLFRGRVRVRCLR